MNKTLKPIASLAGWIAITVAAHLPAAEPKPDSLLFRFGAVADCQYCKETSAVRKYNLSPKKLAACVDHYNKLNLAFVVHLGDFIDRDFESFDVVAPIYNRLKAPHYHVLGNHDFSVADNKKALVPRRMGLKKRYYDFTHRNWRFIVLDGNDVSLYAYPKDDPRTKAASAFHRRLKAGTPTGMVALAISNLNGLNPGSNWQQRPGNAWFSFVISPCTRQISITYGTMKP